MADKTRTTGLRTGIPSGATGSSPPSFLPRRNLVPTYLSTRRIVMTPWNLFVRFQVENAHYRNGRGQWDADRESQSSALGNVTNEM
jgi:hypothetical protein